MRIAIAGGGTAGHVNPAIALAQEFGRDADILFIGTLRGIEARIVPAAGFDLSPIQVVGFDRSKPWQLPVVGARALGAVAEARSILKRFRPRAVVGMGGYVSLPSCLAATSSGIPVVLHEQNIVLGLAHKVSKPFARRVAVSFEETLPSVGPKGVFTGNPVMARFLSVHASSLRSSARTELGLAPDRSTVLVFGGSLGAQRINAAATVLARLWSARTDVQILHITGSAAYEDVTAETAGVPTTVYRAVPFIEDMVSAYAVADVAVCRGGATTVAELCVMGVPSVIVPYPHHRDRQQERHGAVLEAAGAAILLADADTSGSSLDGLLTGLLAEPERLAAMSEGAKKIARPDAGRRLADVVEGIIA